MEKVEKEMNYYLLVYGTESGMTRRSSTRYIAIPKDQDNLDYRYELAMSFLDQLFHAFDDYRLYKSFLRDAFIRYNQIKKEQYDKYYT